MRAVLSSLVGMALLCGDPHPSESQSPWPLREAPYVLGAAETLDSADYHAAELALMRLPSLATTALPDGATEMRLWVVGPGPTIPQSLLRLTAFGQSILGEVVLWWEQESEPFVGTSLMTEFETSLAAFGGTESCRRAQTGRAFTRAGQPPERAWQAACHFGPRNPAPTWASIVAELEALGAFDIGSNEPIQILADGTIIKTADGTSLRGEIRRGSDYHSFQWFNPARRSEPGADRAARISEIVLELEAAILRQVFTGP